MKTIAITALALIGGFFAGLVLSEIIGIIVFFLFDKLVGFQLLPFVAALAAAGTAVAVTKRRRRHGDGGHGDGAPQGPPGGLDEESIEALCMTSFRTAAEEDIA